MNVLSCVACGSRLTEPVRRLDEMPEYPGWDGLPDPDGRRHGPPSVPRGTYVVDPQPFGAPFEPIGPGDDERGFLVAAGPRGTYVLHPDDVVDLVPHPDPYRLIGCCGPDGRAGINHVCVCGAEVAIVAADCTSRYETRLVPDAVRPQATA
jgi:hypothetical protein